MAAPFDLEQHIVSYTLFRALAPQNTVPSGECGLKGLDQSFAELRLTSKSTGIWQLLIGIAAAGVTLGVDVPTGAPLRVEAKTAGAEGRYSSGPRVDAQKRRRLLGVRRQPGYLQHFSPGRHPAIEDFAASALGALCGGLAIALLWRRLSL
jgi:hypothetical protein